MKHTDFFSIIKRIKAEELKELTAALKMHGGAYGWTDINSCPVIAVNTDSGPTDAAVLKASAGNAGLRLECADTSSGECLTFEPGDVFAGHLSYITDSIPPKDGTDDVTAPKEYFSIAWLSREDLAARGFDTARVTDKVMRRIARKMADAYYGNGYNEDIDMAAVDAGLEKRKTATSHGL